MSNKKKPTRLVKILTALNASLFAFALGIILVSLIDYIDLIESGTDYKTSLVTTILGTTLLVCSYLVVVAMVAIWIYHFLMRKMGSDAMASQEQNESLLQGTARNHEVQIIDLLKSIAKPSAGKQHLNRAPTAQFLRALTELGYLEANVSGPSLMAWVEYVTGYKDKDDDSGHFYAAYNKATKEDSKVRKYMDQIEQIVAQ